MVMIAYNVTCLNFPLDSKLPAGFSGEDRTCAECIEISLRPVSPCTCEQCMTDVEYEEYHEQLKKITEGQKIII